MTYSSKTIASWSVIVLILVQFIPLNRINPPASSKIQLPNAITSLLKKACYDCHSYETRWTRIAYVAPASWFVSGFVSSGRSALNFSTVKSDEITPLLSKKIQTIVKKGNAHQQLYHLLKPEAQLSTSDTELLLKWLNSLLTTRENSV